MSLLERFARRELPQASAGQRQTLARFLELPDPCWSITCSGRQFQRMASWRIWSRGSPILRPRTRSPLRPLLSLGFSPAGPGLPVAPVLPASATSPVSAALPVAAAHAAPEPMAVVSPVRHDRAPKRRL